MKDSILKWYNFIPDVDYTNYATYGIIYKIITWIQVVSATLYDSPKNT